ncbi:MAG: GNA1162 family protein [Nitrospirota bacterium]
MRMRFRWFILIAALTSVVSGCVVPHVPPPTDPTNPLKRVAVLPMKNDTNDVDGPNTMRNQMVAALKNRSYSVMDIKESDQILRDRMGINLGGQLEMTTPQKLGETLGVQGVLYGELMDFDETITGLYNAKKVRGKFKLVNTLTGQTMWERGLGVKVEQGISSGASALVKLGARVADAREKEAPWILISNSTTNQSIGQSFGMGLGLSLLSKAMGNHLEAESARLARLVTDNLAWGPGEGVAMSAPAVPAVPAIVMPEVKTPAPPSFGYMDWEGKKNFYALVRSVSLNKADNKSWTMEAPLWITGPKMKMEMDMTRMMEASGAQNAGQMPMSRMTMLNRGDKKMSYSLYPGARKYLVHTEAEGQDEKPKVEKTKVGTETIDGHPCDKYKVVITYKSEQPQEGFIWNARDLGGMTIRSVVENKDFKITTDLKNIVLKSSPASVFEIPAGYTEAKNFMEIMMAGSGKPEQTKR